MPTIVPCYSEDCTNAAELEEALAAAGEITEALKPFFFVLEE